MLTKEQITEAASLAKRLADWRDDVPWDYITDINSINGTVANLEYVGMIDPETEIQVRTW